MPNRSPALVVPLLVATFLLTPGSAVAGAGERSEPVRVVAALRETPTAFDDDAGGNADADDPAIWVHRSRPEQSVVLGTLKNGGLAVYDLKGRIRQHIEAPAAPGEGTEGGRFNNVDIALGVRSGSGRVDLAVVSDRGRDRVRTYRIDPRGAAAPRAVLTDVTAPAVTPVFSVTEAEVDEQRTAYGLTATVSSTGVGYVVTSRRRETELAVLRLVPLPGGRFGYTRTDTATLPASFRLPDGTTWSPCADPGEGPQVEGMVIDHDHRVLYAAQEDVGVWRIPVRAGRLGVPRLVDRVREYGVPAQFDPATEECAASGPDPGFGGRWLSADAEGLTVADTGRGGGYLLASSQGDSTFAAYTRTGANRYVGGFVIGERAAGAGSVDGAQHSDGAAVVTTSLGPDFPGGLLVVHDGEEEPERLDEDGETRVGTDFTFARWRDVARLLPRP